MAGDRHSLMVMHVLPAGGSEGDSFSSVIALGGGCEVICRDVYRAMARLVVEVEAGPDLLLVCGDGLCGSERDFFRLVGSRFGDLPVYVYGRPHLVERLKGDGRLAGARIVDLVAFSEIVTEYVTATETAKVPVSRPEAEVELEEVKSAEDEPLNEPSLAVEADEHELGGEGKEGAKEGSARVPWLRYEGGPRRRPPERVEEPSIEGDEVEASEMLEDEPPLLTPEELDALIGKPGSDVADEADEASS